VLVVDDDADCRQFYRDVLEGAGYVVSEACDGARAHKRCELEAPDVLVLDYAMPVMNGLELAEILAVDRRWSRIPIIFVSGSDVAIQLRTNVVACLRKPPTCGELRSAIERVVPPSSARTAQTGTR
jgi:CheY-like chemotaxis protein